jgi:hypothetical protein
VHLPFPCAFTHPHPHPGKGGPCGALFPHHCRRARCERRPRRLALFPQSGEREQHPHAALPR